MRVPFRAPVHGPNSRQHSELFSFHEPPNALFDLQALTHSRFMAEVQFILEQDALHEPAPFACPPLPLDLEGRGQGEGWPFLPRFMVPVRNR